MKRATLVALGTIAGVTGVLGLNPESPTQTTASGFLQTTSQTSSQTSGSTQAVAAQTANVTRTISGSTVNTRFGPIQLKATVTNGKISDIQVVQYPSNDGHSIQISRYALPVLIQQTLTTQTADIQGVGGATYTTMGYKKSMQSILDQL